MAQQKTKEMTFLASSEPGLYVDPGASLIGLFKMLKPVAAIEFRAGALDRVTIALAILAAIDSLLEFDFWDTLVFSPETVRQLVPNAYTRRKRRGAIAAHMTLLQGDSASLAAAVARALDFAYELVDQLNAEFSLGRMPAEKPAPDHARYYCAAMIQVLAQQFEEVWARSQQNPIATNQKLRGRHKTCRG
jgi:hypothetical protein